MTDATLIAHHRSESGKGAARRLRRQSLVPAIVYGPKSEPIAVAVSPKEFAKIALGPKRRNSLISLALKKEDGSDDRELPVMIKDVQIEPTRRDLLHVDFAAIDMESPVIVPLPFRPFGRSSAVVKGGRQSQPSRTVKVSVLPTQIPVSIDYDTSKLDFGTLRASDIPLPEGCTLADEPHLAVLVIKMPRGQKATDDAEAAAAG